jgi:Protein of unknown function (DUF4254)
MAPAAPDLHPMTPVALPKVSEIVAAHDALLAAPGWPAFEPVATGAAVWPWVQANHRYNSLLWAEEDLARRTTVLEADIAANKRAIDRYNQARNDATERLDELLLLALGLVDEASASSDAPLSRAAPGARLNSETAGSMIDRLSILALKIKAMRAQTEREDIDPAHRHASGVKLARLQQQRGDLAGCLAALLQDAAAGRAYFKVYRQFKMYNDPRYNPALVAERAQQLAPNGPTGLNGPQPE